MALILEDLALCAYALCEDDFSEASEFLDCVPEALYTLHSIASKLNTKIRFSTVVALIDHVVEFNKLKEWEVAKIIDTLSGMINSKNTQTYAKQLLRMLLRNNANIDLKEQDLIEIAIATLYASLTKTVHKANESPPLIEIPSLQTEATTTII
uniref:Uncharacterized protein n=1 Tax=Ignisphaera aggregans TaxID=334771 RepID=A0A7C2V8U9_9CREN